MFLLRQDPASITQHGDEMNATRRLLGRSDLHNLHPGIIGEKEIQNFTTQEQGIEIQVLLVKIHDVDPNGLGGEYEDIKKLLEKAVGL